MKTKTFKTYEKAQENGRVAMVYRGDTNRRLLYVNSYDVTDRGDSTVVERYLGFNRSNPSHVEVDRIHRVFRLRNGDYAYRWLYPHTEKDSPTAMHIFDDEASAVRFLNMTVEGLVQAWNQTEIVKAA